MRIHTGQNAAVLILVIMLCGCGSPGAAKHATDAAKLASDQAKERGLEALRKVKIADGATIDFCFIPGGEFQMGTPPAEPGRDVNDLPQQKRSVDGFYISACPVTQLQYSTVMDENPSTYQNKDYPVHMVKFSQAEEFCKKLGVRIGETIRLPTEVEWEYACRAGETTPYASGSDEKALAEDGWYAGNAESRNHLVGTKKPNAWGVYDMHGNVWQWCADSAEITLGSSAAQPTHALRGGSWMDAPAFCRAGSRVIAPATFRNINIGFRVVMAIKK